MPKRSTESIKSDELTVLQYLERHAKENIDDLAKKCGFSRQKISRIIKQLEEKKTIWGYTAVTDDSSKNLKHFVLLVKRSTEPLDEGRKREVTMEKLDDYVPGELMIDDIFITHGMFDGVVTFYAKDILSARKLVQAMSGRLDKYFKEYILLESLFPIQKQGFKNPEIKNLVDYI